jgi:hypothetical protein
MNRHTYRGKSGIENDERWYYGSLIESENGMIALRFEKTGDINFVPINPETLGQFFYQQNNGTNIFEGDFLQDEKGIQYQVYWDQNKFGFTLDQVNGEPITGPLNIDKMTVVGNTTDGSFQKTEAEN